MNPVRASDYSDILARMAWVFQGLLGAGVACNAF